jgi:hypothetical protein
MEKMVRGNRYVKLRHDLEFKNQDIAKKRRVHFQHPPFNSDL